MLDCFNRKINYLRISVTDRCNFRCTYCMPEEGVKMLTHKEILSFDEIVEIVKYGVANGISKVRITGGEPLVRKGIVSLVEMIAKIDGIKDLSMTTNGALLPKYAEDLKQAGLQRVNISLDTLDADIFKKITRVGDLNIVLAGIEAAKKAGLEPIKLNCVIKKSSQEPDAQTVAKFAEDNGLFVRFIHEMNLETGEFSVVEGGEGGNCAICNRLRLTADGMLKPCLFSNDNYDIRELGIEKAFTLAINNKPKSGHTNTTGSFYNIGG
ncbi:MAG: GTP 3',8-cyclase MoaA [Salinivirgaceae bacterium]|nr:GTP 3',8-cyclase MoaA [Salinivirgaceae bacterium]